MQKVYGGQKLWQSSAQITKANQMMQKIIQETIRNAESQGLKVEIFQDELLITEANDETNGKA